VESDAVKPLRSAYDTHLSAVSAGTRGNIAYRLRVAADVLWPGTEPAECPWHEVDAGSLYMLRARLQDHYQYDSANNILSSVRALLRIAYSLGQVDIDQLQRAMMVPPLKGSKLPAGHYVADEQWTALFASIAKDRTKRGIRDLAILCIMRGTGCRRAELCSLDVGDVDLHRLVVKFRVTKGNKQRESGLPEWARGPVAEWLRLRGPAPGALFFRFNRSKITYGARLSKEGMQVIFKRIVTEAGMPELTTHDMRRGHITSALASGVDIATIAKNVGHASPITTMQYDKRTTDTLIEAAQRVPNPLGDGA
jgi:integrase/recombinase XerD